MYWTFYPFSDRVRVNRPCEAKLHTHTMMRNYEVFQTNFSCLSCSVKRLVQAHSKCSSVFYIFCKFDFYDRTHRTKVLHQVLSKAW